MISTVRISSKLQNNVTKYLNPKSKVNKLEISGIFLYMLLILKVAMKNREDINT